MILYIDWQFLMMIDLHADVAKNIEHDQLIIVKIVVVVVVVVRVAYILDQF